MSSRIKTTRKMAAKAITLKVKKPEEVPYDQRLKFSSKPEHS